MITYGLTREEYGELYGPQNYSKSTTAACEELRNRGYAIDVAGMAYLLKSGVIPQPRRNGGRNLRWCRENIDAAAYRMEISRRYTPCAASWMTWGIRFADALRARRAAIQGHPMHHPDRFAILIRPGSPVVDTPGTVEFIPPPPGNSGVQALKVTHP